MGNICSKSSNKDDNFSTPGRPLGSSSNPTGANKPTTNPRTPVPQKVSTAASNSSPGRALGSRDGTRSPEDAKAAAAKAAEERANAANKSGGKLKTQLDAQRKKTQNQTLSGASEEERLVRAADENVQNRNWN